jgi:hypothetical protein
MRGSPQGVDPQSVGHAPPREEETMRIDVGRCGWMRTMPTDACDRDLMQTV